MTCFLISSYVFRCTSTTVDLLSVVSVRFARAFDWSGSTRAVALEIYKAFDSIYHAGVFHKRKSYGQSVKPVSSFFK